MVGQYYFSRLGVSRFVRPCLSAPDYEPRFIAPTAAADVRLIDSNTSSEIDLLDIATWFRKLLALNGPGPFGSLLLHKSTGKGRFFLRAKMKKEDHSRAEH